MKTIALCCALLGGAAGWTLGTGPEPSEQGPSEQDPVRGESAAKPAAQEPESTAPAIKGRPKRDR